jgi:hypothetical protein
MKKLREMVHSVQLRRLVQMWIFVSLFSGVSVYVSSMAYRSIVSSQRDNHKRRKIAGKAQHTLCICWNVLKKLMSGY